MKVTKSELKQIINEELQTVMSEGWQRRAQVMKDAGLDRDEMIFVAQILNDTIDTADFYGSPAFNKLLDYLVHEAREMPPEIAGAKTGDPDVWILDYIEGL